ncbi:MAG: choice-of-anchor J domain-containing protein [Cyclobacteriaceae bacterium]
MKNRLKVACILATVTVIGAFFFFPTNSRSSYETFLKNHPYMNREFDEVASMKKQDRPDLAWELDYLLTMDPATGQPERTRLLETYKKVREQNESRISSPGDNSSPWVERGPTNVGGRTRAVVFDPNTTNKVWAGGVGGGLWYNNDITDANSSWTSVDDFWDNLSITSIVFDPNNNSTMYVGTGEGWGTGAARGAGVWKSTDGGSSWNQLSATSDYYYVNDLVVRDESSGVNEGVLYVATTRNFHRGSNHGQDAINVSTDGGVNFTSITSVAPTDLCIGNDNRIWAGTDGGDIVFSDDGTTWTTSHSTGLGRVAIACAASDANYIYALVEDGGAVGTIVYTSDKGTNWNTVNEPADVDNGIPDDDFTRGQAWYDLVIAVDPNDENAIVVGGIDLFRSTDNGTNWTQISKWSNNNNLSALNASLVHADQHAITFKGAGSNEVLFGNDGGVFYSADLTNAGTQAVIPSRNNNYNVTQYYACAIHPEAGKDFFLAGAQDNGSQRYTESGLNATVEVNGGDGAYCFIDQTDPQFQITSYVFNVYDLSTNEGQSFFTNLQNDQNTGLFINPADYDDNQDVLFSSRDANSINRISGVTTTPSVDNISVSLGSTTSHLRVSPFTTASSTLFAGTLSGRVFKITNANATPSSTEITGPGFPTASISSIEIGASEDELLVTFSNYGVVSVWHTSDGGTNWSDKEGNLPDMPVRWALFNPNNRSEVLLATELGVWRTSNIGSSSPTWTSSNSGLANVRTDMLQLRTSDNEVIAATHGRGLFSSNGFQVEAPPSVDFTSDVTIGCGSTLDVTFSNLTSANPAPTAYSWSFPGGSPSSSTEQNPPVITYSSVGNYDVTLTVTNSSGQSTETKTNYISIGTAIGLPFEEGFESTTFPPECWYTSRGLNGLGTISDWTRITGTVNSGSGAAYVQYEPIGSENSEDWLVTPELDFQSTINNSLAFYARQSYSTDFGSQYHIKVSTTSQTDLTSFTDVQTFTEGDFTNTAFTQLNVDLSAYDGMTIYLAFVMEQNDGDDWLLDDVSVTGTPLLISASNGFDICAGETTTLSILNDAGATYQWKLDGNNIAGATTHEHIADESGDYSVDFTKNSVTTPSDERTVTIKELPVISTQPTADTKCVTETATLEVVASGSNLVYQWQLDDIDLADDSQHSGTTGSVLSIIDLTAANQGSYNCIVTSEGCDIFSDFVDLTVEDLVAITSQPSATDGCEDEEVVLSVTATGTDLTYQWFHGTTPLTDDANITGSATNTLTIAAATITNAGNYSCEIASVCENTVISEEVTLTVNTCLGTIDESDDSIQIYPNPTPGTFVLNTGKHDLKILNVTIYSIGGEKISSKGFEPGTGQEIPFDISDLPDGIYLMVLDIEGKMIQRQVIKQ